jgi:SH3-like domain-containing protein
MSMRTLLKSIPLALAALLAVPAAGQNREVPYWASLRAGEVNMRVGPSEAYPISWVYQRAGLPVKVVRVNQGWRLVEDPGGTRGWVVARLLKPERSALVVGKGAAEIRADADGEAKLLWQAEPGVVGQLGKCENAWCRFSVGQQKGWIRSSRLWGAGEP